MWETAGLIEFLSFRELQAIGRSYVNGFGLQLQSRHLRWQIAISLAAEIPRRVHAWSRATIEPVRGGIVGTRGRGKFTEKHA
jgi:hypothetical protein